MTLLVFVVVLAVVVAIAAAAVGLVARRLADEPPASLFEFDEAVEFVATALPAEVSGRLSYGDVRKSPRLIQHIMTKVAPLFADRNGGYTRIIKLGRHRLGDGGDIVLLQLVGAEDGPQISSGSSRRRKQADNRTEFAAKLRKDSGKKVVDAPKAEEAVVEESAVATEEAPVEESSKDKAEK